MKVEIDGKRYVPEFFKPVGTLKLMDKALNTVIPESDAGDSITVAQYFATLLKTMWEEQEGFSGKRPFGNSGWGTEVYVALIESGYLKGKIEDDDGFKNPVVAEGEHEEAKILDLIQYMCCGSP